MPTWPRLPTGWRRSILLLAVAFAAFLVLIALTPRGPDYPLLAIALFVGVLGLLKLLSQFEKPA